MNVTHSEKETSASGTCADSKTAILNEVVWRNVIFLVLFHIGAVYGFYIAFTSAMWQTVLFALSVGSLAGLGLTAGMHRLWTHRSYKAKLPLKIFLAIGATLADQGHIFAWSRDHRVHHKYSDTDADPHNSKRGFFFSHIGWLCFRKNPEVIKRGNELDLSDLLADPVVSFQRRYYKSVVLLLCFVLPSVIPTILWGESFINSFLIATVMRHVLVYHQTFCINSVAHMWGNRPYDKSIYPADNILTAFLSFGEGFHNYHHTFPWDYSTSEYGMRLNLTTAFIDLMAWMGLAYGLRTVSPEMIRGRKNRTGEEKSY